MTLREAFDAIDADHNGSIDAKELGDACTAAGHTVQRGELVSTICDLDDAGDGVIAFDAFQTFFHKKLQQAAADPDFRLTLAETVTTLVVK